VEVVLQAVEKRADHVLVPEEVVPAFVFEISSNDRGFPVVPFLHEFEEDAGLLGPQIEVDRFVDGDDVDSGVRIPTISAT